ncbi:MAG TPA: ABC transporter permease [Terracidiphilus sp.]|nr:ABC transporter permease [Terracidiphilus sp.]
MDWIGELGRRVAMLFHRGQFRADLEEEMRLHVDLRQQRQQERGSSPGEARTEAQVRFGSVTALREKSQAAWGWTWLESLVQDTIYGVRAMLHSPGITAVALLSLALGIGANTAVFSLIDAILLRSLPVRDPGRLVALGDPRDSGISDEFARTDLYAYPVYRRIQKENQVFSDTAAVYSMTNDVHGYVAGRAEQEPIQVQLVSGTYFPTLGVQAMLGRTLTEQDDSTEGNHPVAVISYKWWTRDLGRDARVLDQTLRIDSKVYSIIGVAPPEFFGTMVGQAPDVWIPLSMSKAIPPHWGGYTDNTAESLYLIGRLRPGVTLAQATGNVNVVYQQIFHDLLPTFREGPHQGDNAAALMRAHVVLTPMTTGLSQIRREGSEPLRILMTVVVLVLLIACANIANLLLARSTARARELAVRQALGARRARIVRQLLTESLVLALAGGALGIAFASFGARLLIRLISDGPQPLPLDVSLNATLLLFALGVTVFTAILFGTVPAIRATGLRLTDSLKDGRGSSSGAARSPLAKALVVTQLAISLVLLVGAGLFLRSLVNLYRVDSGFNNSGNVLLFRMDESSAGYKGDDPRLALLHRQVEERASALPGIVAASYSDRTFGDGSWNNSVFVQGFDNDKSIDVKHNIVGKDYFATMGIPILAGRGFGPQDTATSQKVAVISQQMAKTQFPAGSPIGRHYGLYAQKNAGDIEIIGVAADVKFSSPDEPAVEHTFDYYPYVQGAQYLNDFEVRYSGDRNTISSEVQKTIHSIDPNVPITRIETLDDRLARSVSGQRVLAQLCSFFGFVAVFLSSIGIYGLMSYLVSRRTNEIGVRIALGADPAQVRRLVLREILLLVGMGLVVGLPVTIEGSRLVASLLYDLKPTDPLTLLGAAILLFFVTMLAGYLPARRASRVDPAVALRCE